MLVYYIYRVPTWTTALDSLAIAQLTKGVDDEVILGIGGADKDNRLAEIDGLVGMVSSKILADEGFADSPDTTRQFQLARGGQGVISKRCYGEEDLVRKLSSRSEHSGSVH